MEQASQEYSSRLPSGARLALAAVLIWAGALTTQQPPPSIGAAWDTVIKDVVPAAPVHAALTTVQEPSLKAPARRLGEPLLHGPAYGVPAQ